MRVTFREAYKAALHEALASDPKVVLLGEDVGAYGGCYAVSKGFMAEFGPERVRDTPLFERIASVQGVFNRLVVYRRNSLHCGRIDNGRALPTDPLQGRLSINAFIDPAG